MKSSCSLLFCASDERPPLQAAFSQTVNVLSAAWRSIICRLLELGLNISEVKMPIVKVKTQYGICVDSKLY